MCLKGKLINMRIWSIHPKYLDTKGLVALWRETLLAKNVLEGKTKGYTSHPQLTRFKQSNKALNYINLYLQEVWHEANARNYNFDATKFSVPQSVDTIPVTIGQMEYEKQHLINKLKLRDEKKFNSVIMENTWLPHPIFHIIKGGIESWERV